MKTPTWVDRNAVLAIQEELLSRFGGLAGVRDEGLLESALHCPRNLYAYSRATLYEMAAAYAAGIVKNHPFLDGNKRAGFLTAYVFLEANGKSFSAPEEAVVVQTRGLAAGEVSEAEYAVWLKESCE
jgi:death on curing protein